MDVKYPVGSLVQTRNGVWYEITDINSPKTVTYPLFGRRCDDPGILQTWTMDGIFCVSDPSVSNDIVASLPPGSPVPTTATESTTPLESASTDKADQYVLVWRNTESGEWRVYPRSLSQSELDLATEVLSLSGCADIWCSSEAE